MVAQLHTMFTSARAVNAPPNAASRAWDVHGFCMGLAHYFGAFTQVNKGKRARVNL